MNDLIQVLEFDCPEDVVIIQELFKIHDITSYVEEVNGHLNLQVAEHDVDIARELITNNHIVVDQHPAWGHCPQCQSTSLQFINEKPRWPWLSLVSFFTKNHETLKCHSCGHQWPYADQGS